MLSRIELVAYINAAANREEAHIGLTNSSNAAPHTSYAPLLASTTRLQVEVLLHFMSVNMVHAGTKVAGSSIRRAHLPACGSSKFHENLCTCSSYWLEHAAAPYAVHNSYERGPYLNNLHMQFMLGGHLVQACHSGSQSTHAILLLPGSHASAGF